MALKGDRKRLGKYQIESMLGKGAMGIVYRAYDPDIKQHVAIKTIRKELLEESDDGELLRRFKNEVIAGRRLKHPHIVSIYEYGDDEDIAYIVMELVQGKPLKEYFEEDYRFELPEIQHLMAQLLDALGYAHARKIIHRDIKPGNILIAENFQIQITDFGIAKIDTSTLTRTGMVMGTPNYMAPEQCLGGSVDARADLFAAGVILYQLLTGEKPFNGGSPMTTMHKVLNSIPIEPSHLNLHIPRAFDAIITKALAKRPEDRYQQASVFAEDLQRIGKTVPSPPGPTTAQARPVTDTTLVEPSPPTVAKNTTPKHPPPDPGPVSKPKINTGLTLAILLLAGLAGGGYWWWQQRQPGSELAPEIPVSDVIETPPATHLHELENLLTKFSCAKLSASINDVNQVSVRGYLRSQDRPALEQAISNLPDVKDISLAQVETLEWPYCEVRQLLDPLRQHNTEQNLGLRIMANHPDGRYREGELLVLELTAPSYEAYLYVDYYQLDGNVVHMLPTNLASTKRYPAGKHITLGQKSAGQRLWQIQPPFGTEMISVIAAPQALFAKARPEVEPAKGYMAVLQKLLKEPDGDAKMADYLSITTGPKR